MKFNIDFERLKKMKEKGFCLCEIKKTDTNICPCDEFLNSKVCKCGVYNEA